MSVSFSILHFDRCLLFVFHKQSLCYRTVCSNGPVFLKPIHPSTIPKLHLASDAGL